MELDTSGRFGTAGVAEFVRPSFPPPSSMTLHLAEVARCAVTCLRYRRQARSPCFERLPQFGDAAALLVVFDDEDHAKVRAKLDSSSMLQRLLNDVKAILWKSSRVEPPIFARQRRSGSLPSPERRLRHDRRGESRTPRLWHRQLPLL